MGPAEDAAALQAPTPTVAGLAKLCLESFQNCLQKAALVHPRELSLVEDQLARLSLWSANIRVFSPGRASLDHRLREAAEVRDIIVGLLEALDYRLRACDERLSSIAAIASGGSLPPVDEKLQDTIHGIADEIDLLHKFSNTIRRASKATQNLNAAKVFHIKDDEGNDVEPLLLQVFDNYIRDRFPGVQDKIRHRLAKTMLLRRKRILYRRSRYGKTSIPAMQVPAQPVVIRPQAAHMAIQPDHEPKPGPIETKVAVPKSLSGVAHTATTLSPDNFRKASTPSVISRSKTVALSTHEELRFPPSPCDAMLRRFERLKEIREDEAWFRIDQDTSLRIRPRSLVQEKLDKERHEWLEAVREVTCPFCFYALPAHEAANDRKWRCVVICASAHSEWLRSHTF